MSNNYPVSLKGEITPPLSRALWLVKWLLAIPHYIILVFLWVAFVFVTIFAFFSILFTAKYPKKLFDFNVGVLRWSWRVGFYSYEALGTDMYPPFSLKQEDYPADVSIEYPERLSHGMVLVKWILAAPHYAVLALLTGWWAFYEEGPFMAGGLLWLLVIFAAIELLFTKKYPADIFKLVMGINRWMYRVIAYVGLMTDQYPPFGLWE
jgi:hypothetical protein